MEELGSGTEMDENTGCVGPGSDTKKVCILCLVMEIVQSYFITLTQY